MLVNDRTLFKFLFPAVPHIQDFGDATASPVGDAVSPARDAATRVGDLFLPGGVCISSRRKRHPLKEMCRPPRDMRHLLPEMLWHLQNLGYVTLLLITSRKYSSSVSHQQLSAAI